MTMKVAVWTMVGTMGLTGLAPLAWAADGGETPQQQVEQRIPQAGEVTHGELAKILVNLLALARFLPPDPTTQQSFAILLQNEIAPPNGWQADAIVTKGDLAVVLVKTLRAMGEEVDIDADNVQQAMAYLREQGIPIDTIGEGVSIVEPLANPVAVQVFAPTTDPLEKRQKFSSTDEQESGADAQRDTTGPAVAQEAVTQEQVMQVVVRMPTGDEPDRPRPTPFQPGLQ